MPYRSSQDTNYVVVRDRKSRRFRDDIDDDELDDDDDEEDFQSEIVSYEEGRRYGRPRVKYYPQDDFDYDYRPARMRKGRNPQRFVYDDYVDDRPTLKIIRNASPVEPRRMKYHSSDRRPIYYEHDAGRILTRPPKKKPPQILYPDDEPMKIMKRVIIDPRTGQRETIYEKDRPRKQQKYIFQEQPAEIVVDSDSDDGEYFRHRSNFVRPKKHRPVVVTKYDDSPKKFIKIRQKNPTVSSKFPPIKTHRRILYEIPGRKVISNYHY